jgi:hypothetical protein
MITSNENNIYKQGFEETEPILKLPKNNIKYRLDILNYLKNNNNITNNNDV